MRSRTNRVAICSSLALLLTMPAATAAVLQAPFDANYQLSGVSGTLPGSAAYAAMAFPADTSTMLLATSAFHEQAVIYDITLTRDVNGHITSVVDPMAPYAAAPGFPGSSGGVGAGMAFGPRGALFYVGTYDNSLSVLGGLQLDLSALTPAIVGANAMTFVPVGMRGAGRLKIATADHLFDTAVDIGDGNGLAPEVPVDLGVMPGTGADGAGNTNAITGLAYVRAGNPNFGAVNLLIATYDYNTAANSTLSAYTVDANGDPILSSRRVILKGYGINGMVVDPQTGDLLFVGYYGGIGRLSGFTVPPQTLAFRVPVRKVQESAGSGRVLVDRVGDPRTALTVSYHTNPAGQPRAPWEAAVDNVHFHAFNGKLHWDAGDSGTRHIDVPVIDDGLYDHGHLVDITLDTVPVLGQLGIVNTDPPPTVTLSTTDRIVDESVGSVTVTASLDHAAGVPVTVPFDFTGTATRGPDWKLYLDGGGKFIKEIVIPPGSTSGSLTIPIQNDQLDEDDETLIVTICDVVNAVAGATGISNTITIHDDDPLPVVTMATSLSAVTEGSGGPGQPVFGVIVQLSHASGREVSVPLSVVSGTVDGRIAIALPALVFPAGAKTDFAMEVADDSIHEGDKTLKLRLGTPTNATLGVRINQSVTVVDDDP